jgi:hypothetical protein
MEVDDIRVSVEALDLLDFGAEAVYFPAGLQLLHAAISLPVNDDDAEWIGSVAIQLFPADSLDDEDWWWMDSDERPDWVVEFDMVKIDRKYLGQRYGLRLVAEALSELSFGRSCLASIVAEPKGWQSLKQRDRGPAIAALDRHWARLGFEGGEVRADSVGDRRMSMLVRDYNVPEFLRRLPK